MANGFSAEFSGGSVNVSPAACLKGELPKCHPASSCSWENWLTCSAFRLKVPVSTSYQLDSSCSRVREISWRSSTVRLKLSLKRQGKCTLLDKFDGQSWCKLRIGKLNYLIKLESWKGSSIDDCLLAFNCDFVLRAFYGRKGVPQRDPIVLHRYNFSESTLGELHLKFGILKERSLLETSSLYHLNSRLSL